eukprot:6046453-Pyramimonas_sp.AAC.1
MHTGVPTDKADVLVKLQEQVSTLSSQVSTLSRPPSLSSTTSSGSQARRPRAASAGPYDVSNPCRLWIRGFPRKLMQTQFEAHYS